MILIQKGNSDEAVVMLLVVFADGADCTHLRKNE